MQDLFRFDQQLFLLINHLPHPAILDQIALFLSLIGKWGAVWAALILYLLLRGQTRGRWFIMPSIVVFIGAMCSEFILKSLIARPRPTEEIGAIIVGSADNFSFPSTHAILAFAFAYILSYKEPKLMYWFYTLAVLISVSRIYIGVHYPLDIIGGAMLGWVIGRTAVLIRP